MQRNLLAIIGIVAMIAIGIGGGLLLFNMFSGSEDSADPSHESTSTSHSGPTNFSEAKVQDITRLSNVNVSVIGGDFQPNNIQIKKGTKVTWINNATENHAIMKENEDDESHEPIPSSAVKEDTLASPTLAKGKVYEFTFNETGKTYYHCPLHPNVRGKVTVVE